MLTFVLRRLTLGLVTLLAASVLVFAMTNLLPGNVAEVVLGKQATPENVKALNHELGLDRSVPARYTSWLGGVIHGDLGDSAVAVANDQPDPSVSASLGQPLVNSLILSLITIALLIPLALLLGTVAGLRAGRPVDHLISTTVLVLSAFPEFVLGTVLILIFFTELDWLPPVALVSSGASPLDHANALVLPVLTLIGAGIGFSTRQVRAGMAEASGQGYVALARLNGISERRVIRRYALRNCLAPSVQAFAQTLQYLIGGIIVVEGVFAYPGIGSVLVSDVADRDVTAVAGIAMVLAALYILINIAADLIVVFLVPKLRTEHT